MLLSDPAGKLHLTAWLIAGLLLAGAIATWFKVIVPLGRVLELNEELQELREFAADPPESWVEFAESPMPADGIAAKDGLAGDVCQPKHACPIL
jgi:hypothetical protein